MTPLCFLPLLFGLAAAAPDRPALAVVEKISGHVGFYTASGRRVAEVKLGAHPHEIILSPDRRLLYVTDNGILWMTDPGEGGNTVSIIDVATRRKVGAIDLGKYRRPHGIDIHPQSGRMAVTIENPDGMLLIDPAARRVLRMYDVKGADPHMVVFDKPGQWAYVSNTASGTLAAVELASGSVKVISTGARPQGAALSHDGKILYLTNSDGNSISLIDTAGKEVVGTIATARGPGRIAITPDGKTLVYNLQAGEAVGFADIASRRQTAVVPLGGRPLSLTMSPDGRRAYAGIQDQDRICVLSVPDRKIVQVIRTPKGAGPDPALPLP
ncbi:MAG: hypothetical protein IT158_28145 [Bryobacterales bacterium]|nr:hypothetical protein [Bryobacterales bacterium]